MPLGDYLVGLVFFAGIWGAAGAVAAIFVQRRLGAYSGAPLVVGAALVYIAALLGVHLVPGALGILSRVSVLITALVAALIAWRFVPRVAPSDRPPAFPPHMASANGLPSTLLAAASVTVVVVFIAAAFAQLVTLEPMHIDALSFGLPVVAHWLRSGSLWDPGAFIPLFQVRTYPNNGDLVSLAAILPWRNDAFLRFPVLPLLGITGLSVYAIARELRASAALAALVAALVLSTRVLSYTALDQLKPDVFMYATFAAGTLFLLRHARTGRRGDLLLAGLGLGLSFGSRWYGVSSVVVVAGLWVVARLLAGRPFRVVARDGLVLGAMVLAAGGFWLVRNAAETGNPIYPIKVAALGITVFGAPHDIITDTIGFTLVDRLGQGHTWTHYVVPDYRAAIGAPGLVLLLGTLAALALVLTRGNGGWRRRVASAGPWLVLGTGTLAAVYAITPGSAQGTPAAPLPGLVGGNARWLVPALLFGAAATAWALARLPRGRLVAEVAMLAAVIQGIRISFEVSTAHLARAVLVLAVVAGGGLLAVRALSRLPPARRWTLALAGAFVLLLGAAAVGQVDQRRYNDHRFVGKGPVTDWVLTHAAGGHRIALAGDWNVSFTPTYAMFGPRLRNHVSYLGAIRRGQLRQYHRAAAFETALERGRYDLLIVGRVQEPDFKHFTAPATLKDPEEARWARSRGYREVTRDGSFILLASPALARQSQPRRRK
jgi:hypothetical protein